MYKRILIFLFFLTGLIGLCNGQDSSKIESATVYLIRSTGMTKSGTAFSAFIDDEMLCHLNNNRYSIHLVQPGMHKFQARFTGQHTRDKIQTLDIPMEAEQTYYISLDITNHNFYVSLYLIEITANTARKILPSLKEDNNCN